jgi:1,2-phenylacetyl-CoA epoxidase catalytic subunit
MTQAQAQVDKVSKKYNALVEKCNELQDKFVNLSVEQERIQMEVMNERAERESLQAVTVRVSDLTVENENTNQLYFKATQDALDAKQELEGSVPKQIRN